MNLEAHYRLPLRDFVSELKQFYQVVDGAQLRIALLVQPSMVKIIETMIKTLVTRESMQYFTQAERAYLWLQIEYKKYVA